MLSSELLTRRYSEKNLEVEELETIRSLDMKQKRDPKIDQIFLLPKNSYQSINDDFCILINQKEQNQKEQINKNIAPILKDFRNILLIGIIGSLQHIIQIIESLIKQKIEISRYNDGLYLSRKFKINSLNEIQIAFVIRIGCSLQNIFYDYICSIMTHVLIIDEECIPFLKAKEIRQKNKDFIQNLFQIQQSLMIIQNEDEHFIHNQNLFIEIAFLKINEVNKNQIQNQLITVLERNLKRNFHTIINILPLYFYYIISSIYSQIKQNLTLELIESDFCLDSHKVIHTYLQTITKQVKYQYRQQIQYILTQSKQDILIYQFLKEYKQMYINKFRRLTFLLKSDRIKYQKKLCEYIKDSQQQVYKRNQQLNNVNNHKIALTCSQKIRKGIEDKKYGSTNFNNFQNDFKEFLESYNKKSCGRSKGNVLREFLYNFTQQLFKYFEKKICEEILENLNKSEKSNQDIESLITLTEGVLQRLEKQIFTLENKRNKLQKQSNQKKKEIEQILKKLKKIKEKIQKQGKEQKQKKINESKSIKQQLDSKKHNLLKWWCF